MNTDTPNTQAAGSQAPAAQAAPAAPAAPADISSFTLSIIVANRAGALSRITGLFSKRGYNIETLTVGPMAEDPARSRLIMTSSGDQATRIQIIKQLRKLFDVEEVKVI